MTIRTARRRWASAVLAGLCGALLVAAPAGASSGATNYTRLPFKGCTAYGSSSGFGITCPGRGGDALTLRELLAGDPVPDCWQSEPPEEYDEQPRQYPGAWWLTTCLDGIDPVTLAIEPGGLLLTYVFDYKKPGTQKRLTVHQQDFVDALVERGQVPLPSPVLSVSPSQTPRVGEVLAFSVTGDPYTRTLYVRGVTMQARLTQLTVEPEGEGVPKVTCTGQGRQLTAAEIDDADLADKGDDLCAYRYDRSSFQAGDDAGDANRYPARVTASWTVFFGDGEKLGTFDKVAVNELRVAEIQTLVVSGTGA